MSLQVISDGSGDGMSNAGTEYICLAGSGNLTWSATENLRTQLVSTSGKLSNFRVELRDAPGAGKSWTFTVMLNGAVTDLSITISDTATEGSDSDTISVSAGDTLSLKSEPSGAPTATDAWWCVNFISDTEKERLLMCAGPGPRQTGTYYIPLQGPSFRRTEAEAETHIPMSATIKNLYVKLNVAPGVGSYRNFQVRKNGVTTSLFVQITHNDTTGNNIADTVSVSAGDVLSIEATDSGIGISVPTHYALGLTAVTDSAEDEFMFNNSCSTSLDELPAGGNTTKYASISAGDSDLKVVSSTSYSLANAHHLLKYYVEIDSAPGAGSSRTFTVRKNGADTDLTVTISNLETSGSCEAVVFVDDGDELNQKIYSTGQFLTAPKWRTSLKCALARITYVN